MQSQNARNCTKQLIKLKKIMKALNYFITFLGGVAIGSVAGLLLAPEKGSDTRERIAEALRKRGIKLNKKDMDALVSDISEEIANAAATGEEA